MIQSQGHSVRNWNKNSLARFQPGGGAGKFLGTKNSEKRSKKFRKVKDLGSRDTVLEIGTKIGTKKEQKQEH